MIGINLYNSATHSLFYYFFLKKWTLFLKKVCRIVLETNNIDYKLFTTPLGCDQNDFNDNAHINMGLSGYSIFLLICAHIQYLKYAPLKCSSMHIALPGLHPHSSGATAHRIGSLKKNFSALLPSTWMV